MSEPIPATDAVAAPPPPVEPSPVSAPAAPAQALDLNDARVQAILAQLIDRPSMPKAIFAGLIAAFLGAGVWIGITFFLRMKLSVVALVVALIVCLVVRFAGKGRSAAFGLVGVFYTLLGCALAYPVIAYLVLIKNVHVTVTQQMVFAWIKQSFTPLDAVFYGVAVLMAFWYSYRRPEKKKPTAVLQPTV